MEAGSETENVITIVARRAGIMESVLRLMISLLAGLPLAFIYRAFCYRKNASIQHLFISVCGLALAFFCFGWSCLHSVFNVLLAYLLLRVGGPQTLTVILMFLLNVGYLIIGYAFKSYSQDYSVSWTTAHCVLCLRLTGLAWDYYDGHQDQRKLSEDFKRTAICHCPSLLELVGMSHFSTYFFQFPMKKYLALIEGKLIDKKDDASYSRVLAGVRRFTLGLIYLALYTVLQPKFKESFLITEEYDHKSFFYKLCYAIGTTKASVMKYQAVWLIAVSTADK
ncbi:lysophospholipid acyltransferase 5-like [Orbicella faveolata]|uniref:lysophospholipid acyltransferase 5-like n=1 Tax=Orbicella faveolata TaxID=48498 RepID=UPI0009E22005|nr:lysophospholipid acyltransferase 5-like [Orbicella faveolata]